VYSTLKTKVTRCWSLVQPNKYVRRNWWRVRSDTCDTCRCLPHIVSCIEQQWHLINILVLFWHWNSMEKNLVLSVTGSVYRKRRCWSHQ